MWQFCRVFIHLRKPSVPAIRAHAAAHASAAWTYAEVGWTRDERTPVGFVADHNRELLGAGREAFDLACEALRGWRMFPAPLAMIEPRAPIRVGETVGVLVHALGVWWLNAARIVYVIDEPRRFGFAYGTLPGHVECGEERFLVEWGADDQVWYDLRAFSRPRYWVARAGRPLVRRLQHRFGRLSRAAMAATVRRS